MGNTRKKYISTVRKECLQCYLYLLYYEWTSIGLTAFQVDFFEDVGTVTLQFMDTLFQRDNLQKSEFFRGLPKIMKNLPKVCTFFVFSGFVLGNQICSRIVQIYWSQYVNFTIYYYFRKVMSFRNIVYIYKVTMFFINLMASLEWICNLGEKNWWGIFWVSSEWTSSGYYHPWWRRAWMPTWFPSFSRASCCWPTRHQTQSTGMSYSRHSFLSSRLGIPYRSEWKSSINNFCEYQVY